MTQPPPRSTTWTLSRLLMLIAAICFFLAALTVCGANILNGPALAWAFGGFAAWTLASVV